MFSEGILRQENRRTSEREEVFYIYITIDLFFVFKWQSGISCLLMPQVSDFQYKAWLLHRRKIGLMRQPIILLIISSLWGYKARNGRLAECCIVLMFSCLNHPYILLFVSLHISDDL